MVTKKRAKAKQHTRTTKTGKVVVVNKGVSKKPTRTIDMGGYEDGYTLSDWKAVKAVADRLKTRKEEDDLDFPIFVDNGLTLDNANKNIEEKQKSFTNTTDKFAIEIDKVKSGAYNKSKLPNKGSDKWYASMRSIQEQSLKLFSSGNDFHKEFNIVYARVLPDLTSKSSVRIGYAYSQLMLLKDKAGLLYTEAAKLKNKKSGLGWSPVKQAVGVVDAIKNRYATLDNGAKFIGLSAKQISGKQRQSSAMRARWGSY